MLSHICVLVRVYFCLLYSQGAAVFFNYKALWRCVIHRNGVYDPSEAGCKLKRKFLLNRHSVF